MMPNSKRHPISHLALVIRRMRRLQGRRCLRLNLGGTIGKGSINLCLLYRFRDDLFITKFTHILNSYKLSFMLVIKFIVLCNNHLRDPTINKCCLRTAKYRKRSRNMNNLCVLVVIWYQNMR